MGKSGVTSGFGAAGSLVALLIWVYYSAQIFLLGAEFTWVYAHEHGSKVGEPEPASAPVVPSHSGEAAAQVNARGSAPISAPQVAGDRVAVAPVAAKGGDVASGPGDFIEQNPIKGLGIVVTVGFVAGAVLRHIAPPARLFGRSPIARGRRLFWRHFP